MKVLGVDVSTKTGIAVVETGKKVIFTEQVEFKKMTGWPRVSSIAGRVMEIREEFQPDLILLEGYGFANANTLVPLVEIGTAIRYFLWQEGQEYLDVPPTSLKKFVLGKGVGKKEMILLEVYKRWGFTAPTNDIADAVGLGMFGLCCAGEKFTAADLATCQTVLKGQPAFAARAKKIGVQCH